MTSGGLYSNGIVSLMMCGSLIIIRRRYVMKRKPTSPGEILKEEFLNPQGLTQKDLSDHLGRDYKVINRIVNEKGSVTPEMAMKFAAAFETTPDFWLNAQMAIDLWLLRDRKMTIRPLNRVKRKEQSSL